MASNPIAGAYEWYRKHGPNPLVTGLLLGGLAYGKGRLLWSPIVDTIRSLGRPIGRGVYGGGVAGDAEWDRSMDELKNSSRAKHLLPALLGLITGAGALYAFANPNQEKFGLLDWDAKTVARNPDAALKKLKIGLGKTAGYMTDSYVDSMDWTKQMPMASVTPLFTASSMVDDPYVRNMGMAIVTNAALQGGTRQPTLGSIFDSAVDKIDKKLTFGGVTDVAVKSVISNCTAKLFTSALDAVVGLNPPMKNALVDAGTWAGTISAILK